ncbi:MAG: radical SAM protein [Polyangia bacterium]|nr:radical SAM protein [Polyangia bacterium]
MGDPRVVIVHGDTLTRDMKGEYLLPLSSGMRLRPGALDELRRSLQGSSLPLSVRFPAPCSPDPEDPFHGRRRRLFGIPMHLAAVKPFLAHRSLLARFGSADVLSAMRHDDPIVLLELELASDGGPGSGAWASAPILEHGESAGRPLDQDELMSTLQQFSARGGRPVSIVRAEGGLRVQGQRIRGIDIELSTRCNARCVFCPQRDVKKKGHMPDSVFKRVLAMIREQPIGTIYFIGRGEPLLHPRFLDCVREIRNWTGIEFEVFTNGLALVPEVVDRLVALNNESLNIAINVSLHSLQEDTHRRLTGTDLRIVTENLKYLHQHRGSLRVSYAFVKNKVNETEMAKLRRHLDRTGNRDWDISLVYNKGGYIEEGELFDAAFYHRQLARTHSQLEATGPCYYSYSGRYYFVNLHGQFTLCHDDFEEDTILGEVGKDSLETIDARVAELHRAGGAARCARCNKRQRELHHGGYGEDVAQVKDWFHIQADAR